MKSRIRNFFFVFLFFWLNLKFINFYRHWLLLVFVNPLRPSFLFGFSDLQWIYFPGMKIRDQAISEILGFLKISNGKSFWNYLTIQFMENVCSVSLSLYQENFPFWFLINQTLVHDSKRWEVTNQTPATFIFYFIFHFSKLILKPRILAL